MEDSSEEQGSPLPMPPEPRPASRGSASRPSLHGAPSRARHGDDDPVSILSAVLADPRSNREAASGEKSISSNAPRALLLIGVLVIAASLYFVFRDGEGRPAAPSRTASAPAGFEARPPTAAITRESALPAFPASAEPPTASSAASSAAPSSASAAAVIESVPDADIASIATSPSSASPVHGAAPVPAAGKLQKLKPDAVTSAVAAGAGNTSRPRTSADVAADRRMTADRAARGKGKQSDDQLVAALNKSASSNGTKQNDADLIQALLDRSAAEPDAKAGAPKKTPNAAGPAAATVIAIGPEAPHDVVDRKSGVSTADLVRKCENFGALEGLLCRIRICSGLWGKDAACPAQSAPQGQQP